VILIKRLEVEGYRYYRDRFAAEFPQGIVVVAGPVGSGKSSLLGAIEYALYGIEFGVRRRMYDRDELVHASRRDMRVRLVLVADEGEYVVERAYERGGRESVRLVTPEGEELTRRSLVNEMLREMLGLDVAEYERTVYLNQVSLYLLAYGTPATRSRVIDSLLGIDAIERITAAASRYLRRVQEKLEDVEAGIRGLEEEIGELEARVAEAREREERLRREYELKREYMERLRAEIGELEARVAELAEVENKFYEYSAEKKVLLRELEGPVPTLDELVVEAERLREDLRSLAMEMLLEEELKRLEELEVSEDRLAEVVDVLGEVLDSVWAIYNRRVEDLRSLEMEVEQRNMVLRELEKKILELEPVVSEYREALQRLESIGREAGDEDSIRKRLRSLELELKRISERRFRERCVAALRGELRRAVAENGVARCPVCGSEVRVAPPPGIEDEGGEEGLLRRRIKELKDLLDELTRLKVKVVEYEESVERYNALLSRREELLSEIDKISAEINHVRVKYRDLGARLSSIERDLGVIRDSLRRRGKAERLRLVEEALEELRGRYEELQLLRRRRDELKDKLAAVVQELSRLEFEMRESDVVEGELLALQERLGVLRDRRRRLRRVLEELKCSLEAYRRIHLLLRKDMIERVSTYMREIVSRVYPYGDIEDVRLSVEEKGEKSVYSIEVKMGGEWRPFTARLSEGQKMVVILALMLSFYKTVSHSASFILLDEPVPNVDMRVKEAIFRGVADVLGIQQVVFTTQAIEVAKRLSGLHVIEVPPRALGGGESGERPG